MKKWQLIETAVQSCEPRLLYDGADQMVGGYSLTSLADGPWGGWYSGGEYCDPQPTHWMELPSPPQAQPSDEEPALAGDEVSAADQIASLTQKIASLEASLALCERRAEDAEARNVFLETEIVALAEKVKKP